MMRQLACWPTRDRRSALLSISKQLMLKMVACFWLMHWKIELLSMFPVHRIGARD